MDIQGEKTNVINHSRMNEYDRLCCQQKYQLATNQFLFYPRRDVLLRHKFPSSNNLNFFDVIRPLLRNWRTLV